MFTVAALAARTPPAQAQEALQVANICHLRFTITTGNDGLREDSQESIRFGGQRVIFLDANGDGIPDADGGNPFHQGGTGDTANTTFVWDTKLVPCVPATALLDGFQFEHYDFPIFDFHTPDAWDLQNLTITDLDRPDSFQYYNKQGNPLHHFDESAFEGDVKTWNAADGQPDVDTDGDGLTDRDELRGFVTNPAFPQIDQFLPQHGADPCRKTIAVEIDWLDDGTRNGNDQPSDEALNQARQMFNLAPVNASPSESIPCPYYWRPPQPGIQLLTDLSDDIHVPLDKRQQPLSTKLSDGRTAFEHYRDGLIPGGGFFTPGRSGRFFYSLWGYAWDSSGTSGNCCLGDHGNDFVITLGNWDASRVTDRLKAAVFVHELGHALDLLHGGTGKESNNKPNYLSVMNYRYAGFGLPDFILWKDQLGRLPMDTDFSPNNPQMRQVLENVSQLDYSREQLPALRRNPNPTGPPDQYGQPRWWDLDERVGIGTALNTVVAWYDPNGVLRVGDSRAGLGSLGGLGGLDWDWNDNGILDPQQHHDNVNVMGGTEVCVTKENPNGSIKNDTLETTPAMDDKQVGTTIIAGPNGKCETTAASTDNGMIRPFTDESVTGAVPSLTFDYPQQRGYESGLDGYNDWRNLHFRIGVSPAANVPLRGPGHNGPTQEDYDQDVAELVKAFVATTHPYDPGPPAHGRLIDTLGPSYTASPQSQLVFYTARSFNPQEVSFEPKAFPGLLSTVLPYIRQPNNSPRRYQLACHVHTDATAGTTFRLTPSGGAPGTEQRRWVPPGDTTVRFTTDTISQTGWYAWALINANNDAWTLTACDFYEQTDDGPAPAAAPAPHPDPPAVQPPTIATLNTGYTHTANAELAMDNLYSLAAAPGAVFRPDLTHSSGDAQITLTTDASPHTYRINCQLRNGAVARYTLAGQTMTAPTGDTTASFTVSTEQAGPHTWTLTELNHVTWIFKSCDINESP